MDITDRILATLHDGRERTTREVAEALRAYAKSPRYERVRYELRKLQHAGAIATRNGRDACGQLCAYHRLIGAS